MNLFFVLLSQPLANGLALFYNLLGQNMGLAIIGFTIFLRVVLNPLSKPYIESMKKIKSYQKELDKLKARHKDDKQKLMKAQADFYKEKGINPSAGCIPQILQIVILIAFFNVFSTVLHPGVNPVEKFNEYLYEPLRFAGDASINTNFLYLDIIKPDTIVGLLPFALPGPILILAALIQFISAKMNAPYVEAEKKLAKKTVDQGDDMMLAMQSSMVYTIPLMTLFIGVNFASGLVLYWFTFSFMQALQQYRSTGWGGLTPWIKRLNLLK